MWEDGENPKSLLNFTTGEEKKCTLKSTLGACNYRSGLYPLFVAGQVVITDLKEQETRRYWCRGKFVDGADIISQTCYANATLQLGAATTSPSTTVKGSSPAGQTSGTSDATLFSNNVVIIILVLLVIAVTAVCVVGAIYCKRRNRKRRKRDCDSLSMRSGMTSKSFYGMSDKGPQFGFDDGPGMQTLTRQLSYSSSAPPKVMAPDVPGQIGRVMQYQKPTDCMPYAGTMASVRSYDPPGASQYHEPWGKTLDDPEILGRLTSVRANRGALVKIPDFEATSSSASYPAPPSASPTQETGPAFI
ncbi:hypothetical protein V1264_017631 [Littorina saxatilis]|uniref:Uncharacterized protein n=2 Tax=Littorina saxatilis TaxID=31220 RepID=A0AAN9GFL7_9CAEN